MHLKWQLLFRRHSVICTVAHPFRQTMRTLPRTGRPPFSFLRELACFVSILCMPWTKCVLVLGWVALQCPSTESYKCVFLEACTCSDKLLSPSQIQLACVLSSAGRFLPKAALHKGSIFCFWIYKLPENQTHPVVDNLNHCFQIAIEPSKCPGSLAARSRYQS